MVLAREEAHGEEREEQDGKEDGNNDWVGIRDQELLDYSFSKCHATMVSVDGKQAVPALEFSEDSMFCV